ncbi:MAG: tetratricopeptide repeat protein [bacterium]|nr:tetratricopeptide repeat protein [bacterium]
MEKAVAEDPDFTAALVRLAKAYQSLGRQAEALAAARRAVEAPGAESGRVGYEARAQEALIRGEPEEARRFLEELVERYPNDVEAYVGLAEAYGQEGKFTEAISRLENAVKIDPSEPRAWYLLGQYAIRAGDSRRAVNEYLPQALAKQNTRRNEEGQAKVLNALGVGYERLGLLEEATESYQEAAEIRRRIGDHRGLASTLHNLGVI